jgi:enediyne biosynthesis protein E4
VTAAAAACATLARNGATTGVFRDVTSSSGIRFRFRSDLQRLKMITTVNGGCAFGDANGDGRPDLYVTNSVPRWGKPNEKSCGRLFENVGGGRFEDVTDAAGVRACGLGMGSFWVDIEGDGDLDLYLTNLGPNQLFINRGDGTFDEASGTGLEDPLFSVGAAFLDFDSDGDVDVVVANYLDSTPEWERAQPQFELRVPDDYTGQPSHLFRNEGNGRFTEVTVAAGLSMPPADTKTLGVAVLDYDSDGRPDLYFVNDRVSNRLFHNRGNGTFEERTAEAGAGVLGTTPRAGMGVAVGDADGDGATDLFVTNFGGEPNSFYRNVEGVIFEDAGSTLGGGSAGLPSVRWGTHFADFDNDGWPDLYVSAAWIVDGKVVPLVFRHEGLKDGVPQFKAPRSLKEKMVYYPAGPSGDYDNDGRLDLFLINWFSGRGCVLLHNESPKRRWLDVQVTGKTFNRMGIGSRVTLKKGDAILGFQEISTGYGYASGQRAYAHFGLGDVTTVDVHVRLPNGKNVVKEAVAADHLLTIEEP